MHIVLVEPEIPGNTGNISRLCAAEHLVLHLVEPLGFSIDDKHLKRAGLDYWDLLEVHVHPDFDSVKRMLAGHHSTTIPPRRSRRIRIYRIRRMMSLYLGKRRRVFLKSFFWNMKRTASASP